MRFGRKSSLGVYSGKHIVLINVHPNDAGHEFVGKLTIAFLEKSFQTPTQTPSLSIPPPLSSVFNKCVIFEGSDLHPEMNNGWHFNNIRPHESGGESATPESNIEFNISGNTIALSFWRSHGPMGKFSVSVDGLPPVQLDAWDEKTWGGYMETITIAKGLKSGLHSVRIRLLQEKNPNSQGNTFRIIALSGGTLEL